MSRTTAGQMNIAVDKRQSGHTMDRNRHRLQSVPAIGKRVIVVMIWKNTVRMIRITLAAKQMEATVGKDAVDAAARFEHRFFRRP